jgi:hypothetical protein
MRLTNGRASLKIRAVLDCGSALPLFARTTPESGRRCRS